MSHDRTSSTDFAEIAITACCFKVGSQDRIERTPQSRTTSARETDLCSTNDIWRCFLRQPIGREIHVICVCSGVVWCHTPSAGCDHSRGKIETICGNKRHVLCSLAHFATNFLAILSRGSYDTKFIQSHEPNFSITRSDCGRSFRKFAARHIPM